MINAGFVGCHFVAFIKIFHEEQSVLFIDASSVKRFIFARKKHFLHCVDKDGMLLLVLTSKESPLSNAFPIFHFFPLLVGINHCNY